MTVHRAPTDTSTGPEPGLYARLLGDAWCDLPQAVRLAHANGRQVRGAGQFRIRHGDRALARLLVKRGLPPASDDASLQVAITPTPDGERWERRFGTSLLRTTQHERNGLLLERMGSVQFSFKLQAAEGALHYLQTAAHLCVGRLRVPLSGWFAPRVEARETAAGPNRTHVAVAVTMPAAGLLIAYDGHVDWEQP